MNQSHPSLDTTARVLKKKTFDRIQNEGWLTQHGLNILERWSQNEPWAVQRLARKWDTFMTVLLDQQEWEHPTSFDQIEWQLRNGLTRHEIMEMGGPDLSCHHAMRRNGIV